MSLLGSAKDRYKNYQEKYYEKTYDARGSLLASLPVEYMGGYGNQQKAAGILAFYQSQIEFSGPRRNKALWFTIPSINISDVAIEGKEDVNRRVTVTRLLTLGIFAFAFKKKKVDKDGFITLVLGDGKEVIFHIKDRSVMELRASLTQAVSQVTQGKPAAAAGIAQGGIADELTKLAKLKDQGIITQADFDKKKSQLLG